MKQVEWYNFKDHAVTLDGLTEEEINKLLNYFKRQGKEYNKSIHIELPSPFYTSIDRYSETGLRFWLYFSNPSLQHLSLKQLRDYLELIEKLVEDAFTECAR